MPIGTCRVNMLIDTGSEVSVVRSGLCGEEVFPWEGTLRGVSGASIAIQGRLSMPVTLCGITRVCQILVADLSEEGILGMDLHCQFGVLVDCGRNTLRVGDTEVRMSPGPQEVQQASTRIIGTRNRPKRSRKRK